MNNLNYLREAEIYLLSHRKTKVTSATFGDATGLRGEVGVRGSFRTAARILGAAELGKLPGYGRCIVFELS